MMHRLPRRHNGWRPGFGVIVALSVVIAGISGPGGGDGTAAAQTSGPCALLMTADIQPLAPNTTISSGVQTFEGAAGFGTCRYTWGAGVGRYALEVTLNEAASVFPSMGPELIKQGLHAAVTAETADADVSDVGDAAMFKADSPGYVHATAYLKNRILQVHLDGFDAREKKSLVIALLKSAASRI
jgi:hypothetical protein